MIDLVVDLIIDLVLVPRHVPEIELDLVSHLRDAFLEDVHMLSVLLLLRLVFGFNCRNYVFYLLFVLKGPVDDMPVVKDEPEVVPGGD